ncbi:hypothetical protein HZZ02_08390 [Streptococcus danieliae]|nr:hypothetical protein [Streptococcus danieliae]
MTDKRRHRAIEKARKKLFVHYKKSYPKEFQNIMDAILAFAEVFNECMNSIKEIEK